MMSGRLIPKDHSFNSEELKIILDGIKNKTLGEIDSNKIFERAMKNPRIKGIAGDVIEESVLGYGHDNDQRPDILVDGKPVEVKTTGVRRTEGERRAYIAKEPMSITAVSPETIVDEDDFRDSALWHKLENLLIIFYHYDSDKPIPASEYSRFKVLDYCEYTFTEEDELMIENDWMTVRDHVLDLNERYLYPESYYPEISRNVRDKLMCLDLAPRNRPRFRLKQSFVDSIVDTALNKEGKNPMDDIKSYEELDGRCRELSCKYSGMTVYSLIEEFGIKTGDKLSKNINETIASRMFGCEKGKINNITLFRKAGIHAKTMAFSTKHQASQDMKLTKVDFSNLLDKDIPFEESQFYEYFMDHQILMIIFQITDPSDKGLSIFEGFKRVSISDEFIDTEVRRTWEDARNIVFSGNLRQIVATKDGVPVKNKNGVVKTEINFPKSQDHKVFFRGGGTDSSNKAIEVSGIKMMSQYIWIRRDTLVELADGTPYL